MARPRHRYPRGAFIVAGCLFAAALLWRAVAVPALVKFPTDVDSRPRYAGTLTMYVDAATSAPLATPLKLPLTIERRVQALGDQSSASKVVLKETYSQKAGDVLDLTQTNQYVMDRSTLENVADPRAYSFTPGNVVDRSGSFRMNLPFDTSSSKSYTIFDNELGTTYQMHADATNPQTTVEGLSVDNFTGKVTDQPVTDAYLAELDKAMPLPRSMTLEQLKPVLKQSGLDVDALLAALQPVLTPADLATLAQVASQPIALQYVLSFDGRASVEPTTGAQVVVGSTEAIGAKPVLGSVDQLTAVLAHYPGVSAATAAIDALDKLATAPSTKLIELTYAQTPDSIADIAGQVKDSKRQVDLVRSYVPFALGFAVVVALATGGIQTWHRRERAAGVAGARGVTVPVPRAARPAARH